MDSNANGRSTVSSSSSRDCIDLDRARLHLLTPEGISLKLPGILPLWWWVQMVGEMESSLERVRRQLSSTSTRHILQGPLLKRSDTVISPPLPFHTLDDSGSAPLKSIPDKSSHSNFQIDQHDWCCVVLSVDDKLPRVFVLLCACSSSILCFELENFVSQAWKQPSYSSSKYQ